MDHPWERSSRACEGSAAGHSTRNWAKTSFAAANSLPVFIRIPYQRAAQEQTTGLTRRHLTLKGRLAWPQANALVSGQVVGVAASGVADDGVSIVSRVASNLPSELAISAPSGAVRSSWYSPL